jgi:uncharacterized protein
MIDLNQYKLELDYPCNWSYKIVIRQEQDITDIIKELLEERKHDIKASKTSSQGKFKSFNLDLVVHNEEDRKSLYQLLDGHEHIKMVM